MARRLLLRRWILRIQKPHSIHNTIHFTIRIEIMRKLLEFILREYILIMSLIIVACMAFGLGMLVGVADLRAPWGMVWK